MAQVKGTRNYGNVYEPGSAARALPESPERVERRDRKEEVLAARRAIEVRVNEKRHAAAEFGKGQVLVLSAAIVLFLACASFFIVRLSAQESLRNDIEKLELTIQTVHHENVILENRQNSSIDYEKVYAYATEELGMSIPAKQQVVTYDQPSVEFVHKYGEIPK